MATVKSILAKITELERRCPGTHIHRDRLEDLTSDEPLVCGKFKVDAPSTSGGIAVFVVNLAERNETMDQWLDNELPRHAPSGKDGRYNIICPEHGQVAIGQAGYRHQMDIPDASWICPLCGSFAEFDDDTYEAAYETEGKEAAE